MKKNLTNKKGFSLVEMLVVIFIFSILGVAITQSLALSLRGSKKSVSIGVVRENVDYTVSTMERLLRNARSIDCLSGPDQLNYVDGYGFPGRFFCDNTNGLVASGSAAIRLTSPRVRILCNASGGYSPFQCVFPANPDIPPSVLIELRGQDTNLGTGVEGSAVTVKTRVVLRTYKY